ncbi:hypothetical protein PV08_11455 [Exophiala spinifera]|uniref:Uncharacterized protein n=1 Tax=Exophiala spinifera TaxID=91928 RepID=A0A0D1Y6K4_9EURO|nr:uncharacterized protein PV08_11455 [Exophiala spinifera]KIW10491.1 hypothetical protein PV08_11455 [Exophiala spinifera]
MEDNSPPRPREDRGPRIPPAKLSDIKPNPTIAIFYRTGKGSPLQLVDGNFSRDAAMIFCDRIRHDFMDDNSRKSFIVTGIDLTGLKETVAWINQCVSEQSIVKYRELEADTPELLSRYANVIIAATYLGVPARDLAEGLTKRMQGIARKVLMSWKEVEWFYTSPALNNCKDSLREVAAASVFWAWWNSVLNEEDTPEELDTLEELRSRIPKLDGDLHDWCERNEAEVKKKWEEKKKARKDPNVSNDPEDFKGWDTIGIGKTPAGSGEGGGFDTGDIFEDNPGSAAPGAWDVPSAGPENGEFGFDSGISLNSSANIKKENIFDPGHGQAHENGNAKTDNWDVESTGGREWADEVIEHQASTW